MESPFDGAGGHPPRSLFAAEAGHGPRFPGFCVSTLPASVLVVGLARPSYSALLATVAVLAVDCLFVPACAKALPARDLAIALAPGLRSTLEAACVTFGPLFSFDIFLTPTVAGECLLRVATDGNAAAN